MSETTFVQMSVCILVHVRVSVCMCDGTTGGAWPNVIPPLRKAVGFLGYRSDLLTNSEGGLEQRGLAVERQRAVQLKFTC